MEVAEVMTRRVHTGTPATTASEAKAAMRRGRFRRLPVLDGADLVGIVAESDLRTLPDDTPLRRVMRSPVITVAVDDGIEQAAKLMLEHKVSVLPVLDGGKLAGILTESDIFEAFCRIMGVMEPSSRVELTIPDTPVALAGIMRVLEQHRVRTISLVSSPPKEPGTRRLVLRLATTRADRLLDDFAAAGATVSGPPSKRTGLRVPEVPDVR